MAAADDISTAESNASRPRREQQRKSRDARRRQAALQFLNNISLDGRPVKNQNAVQLSLREVAGLPLPAARGSGAPAHPSSSTSCIVPLPPGVGISSEVPLELSSPLGLSKPPTYPFSVDTRQRLRNLSDSSRLKPVKKVHFIKSIRQYDTGGGRIVLICGRRSLCSALSVVPYGQPPRSSNLKLEAERQRHYSGGAVANLDNTLGLEGVELGADGKTVSYARFLLPTNALVRQKSVPEETVPLRSHRNQTSARLTCAGPEAAPDEPVEYDPNLLSDPQWPCGKHKRVLIFASYMTTVIEYVKPSDLKKDMNETFKEKFPYIRLTLSKIRSLKREMRLVSEECGLQPVTVAMAFVYFEKMVMQGRLNKQNRKLVSAVCVLLAAKVSSDLRKQEVRLLIDKLEERFRINRREMVLLEFTVLVSLEMALYLPESKVMPHYRRLVQQP